MERRGWTNQNDLYTSVLFPNCAFFLKKKYLKFYLINVYTNLWKSQLKIINKPNKLVCLIVVILCGEGLQRFRINIIKCFAIKCPAFAELQAAIRRLERNNERKRNVALTCQSENSNKRQVAATKVVLVGCVDIGRNNLFGRWRTRRESAVALGAGSRHLFSFQYRRSR